MESSGTNVMVTWRDGNFKTYKNVKYVKIANGVLEMSLADEEFGEKEILHQRICIPIDLILSIHEVHTCTIAEHKANIANFEEWKTQMRGGMSIVTGIADINEEDE